MYGLLIKIEDMNETPSPKWEKFMALMPWP